MGRLKRVGALQLHHVRHLRRVQQRRHARHEVFAEGGGGREHQRMIRGYGGDLGRQRRGQLVLVGGVGHFEDARHAGELCGLRRHRRTAGGEHRHGDLRVGQ
jgi:hypothetical protein